jgi:hypothetical protein
LDREGQLIELAKDVLVLGGDGPKALLGLGLPRERLPDEIGQGLDLVLEGPDIRGVPVELGAEVVDLLFENLDVVVDELVGLLALVLPGRGQGQDGQQEGPKPRTAHVLLLDDLELGPPVHLPGRLVVAGVDGLALAVGDDLDAVGGDAHGQEVVLGALGPLLAEGQVVFLGAALVAMPFDEDLGRPELREPGGVPVEDGPGVVADEGAVIIEIDRAEGLLAVDLVERLLEEHLLLGQLGLLDDGRLDLLDHGLFLLLRRGRRGDFLGFLLAGHGEGEDEDDREGVDEELFH